MSRLPSPKPHSLNALPTAALAITTLSFTALAFTALAFTALAFTALAALWAVGCTTPGADRDAPLPENLVLRLFVEDLLQTGEKISIAETANRSTGQSRHIRATVEVPANAVLGLDCRITRRGDKSSMDTPIGPVVFVVEIEGEEIFRRELESEEVYLNQVGDIPLGAYAGQTVEVDLTIDTSAANAGTGFYWHRATLERYETVERLVAGEGRNVLYVVVDTLRADHMSLYGYPRPTTPNLEVMAQSSLVFDQAFSPASWTLPSTVSLLTGLAPPRHGVVGGGHHLAPRFESLAERFLMEGFTTFAASANPLIGPDLGFDQGFETFSHQPWERANEINNSFYRWLDRAQEHRWFAYLHYIDPHDPYDAPPPGDRWTDPDYDGAFTDPALLNQLYRTINWDTPPPVEVDERDKQHLRNAYDGEILYWDQELGRLLSELESRGLRGDTILIVTSDHGEEFLEHGKIKHGHQLFDESLHVPLLIHAPGRIEAGRHVDPVGLQGLFRATLQLAGIGPATDDRDLLRRPEDAPVFGHTRVPIAPDKPRHRYTVASVRDGGSWFVRDFQAEKEHLFDLGSDPEQIVDRLAEDPDEAQRLRAMLEIWLKAEATGEVVAPPSDIDPETLERLRSLGYIQ